MIRHCQHQYGIVRKPAIRMKQFEFDSFDRGPFKTRTDDVACNCPQQASPENIQNNSILHDIRYTGNNKNCLECNEFPRKILNGFTQSLALGL